MIKLLPILFFSIIFSADELKVEGNLNVTGSIKNDSLAQVISQLEARIQELETLFECYTNGVPEGYCDCFGTLTDACGVCGGVIDNLSDCVYVDNDGNLYNTILINGKLWMAENLNVIRFDNFDNISGNEIKIDSFGDNLYHGDIINSPLGICGEGWHVSTDSDWQELEIYLGMSPAWANDIGWRSDGNVGSKLKTQNNWSNGNNSSGFSATPNGMYTSQNNYIDGFTHAYFWTGTLLEDDSSSLYHRVIREQDESIYRSGNSFLTKFSVRCVKD